MSETTTRKIDDDLLVIVPDGPGVGSMDRIRQAVRAELGIPASRLRVERVPEWEIQTEIRRRALIPWRTWYESHPCAPFFCPDLRADEDSPEWAVAERLWDL